MMSREKITIEWMDSNFKQTYPSGLARVMRWRTWSLDGGLKIVNEGYGFSVCTTVAGDEFNTDHNLFSITYKDQVTKLIELLADCEAD